jgi:flagellar biosynthesis repressor protein FlbT
MHESGRGKEQIMALKVELKPRERIIIGDCVITNDDQRTRLLIDGRTPILREKDIMTPRLATTPAKRIYLAVQLMYTSKDPRSHHDVYFSLVRDITHAAPSVWPLVESINNLILTGDMYKALKQVKKLVAYEEELLNHAKRRTSLRHSGEAGRQPA